MASVLWRWVRPPLVSVLVLGLIAAGVWGFGYRESTGTPASDLIVASPEWVTWKWQAAASAAAFIVIFVLGVTRVLRPPMSWGIKVNGWWRLTYLLAALAFMGVLVFRRGVGEPRSSPSGTSPSTICRCVRGCWSPSG